MVATPVAPGVTQVEAAPPSSLVVLHDEVPPQAERVALLVVLQLTVAPLTGVIPSDATTRTPTGLVACTPTGVEGFTPPTSTRLSVAAAPVHRPPARQELAPPPRPDSGSSSTLDP